MKNKLLISLLIIVTSYLTYSLFFNIPEINDNSSKNGSILSDNTQPSQNPYIIREKPSTVEEINYSLSENNSILSDNTPTSLQNSEKPSNAKENPANLEEEIYNLPENSSDLSDDTQISPITSKKHSDAKENPSNVIDNDTKNSDTYTISNNISSTTNTEKKTITISNFLNSLKCTNYILKSGETLTQVARKYENTCNLNTSLKLIKSINKINDVDNVNSGFTLSIPESIITTGTMHLVTTGDTWYSISQKHYNTYDVNSITKILVYINDLPNNDLPLGESIFLPSI